MPSANNSITTIPTPRRVPEAFLRAEISAFPLASEASFRMSLVELDPAVKENTRTDKLWRECERQLAPHTGWSLDRLVAARDRGWFGAEPLASGRPVSMHDYLRALARSHLSGRAGVTEIGESTDLTALDKADHYRWLTFALPEDLMLAALGVEPAPVRVELDPPLLVRRLVDLGVAEIHQHVGAGMDFRLLWASALAAIATPIVGKYALASPGAPLSEGKELVRWLLAAALARCTLAEYMIRGGQSLETFVCNYFSDSKRLTWTPWRCETLAAVFGALITGDDNRLPDLEPMRDLYADIHPTALTLQDRPLESMVDAYQRCDPIAVRLGLNGANAGERWFMHEGLAYLDDNHRTWNGLPSERHSRDACFARVFWQIVRIRCQYYRAVVERPLTGGLQWFIRFYSRLGTLRAPLDPIQPQVSFRVAGRGHRIRALELRTGANDSAIAIGEQMLAFLRSWQRVATEPSGSTSTSEIGIVFHLIKDRDANKEWLRGHPAAFWAGTFAEPDKEDGMDVVHGRYVDYFDNQCRKALALAELIRAVPSSLWFIRGLDVAKDELGIPTWVLVPLFRHVLDESARVCVLDEDLAPLKITAHVGEDFRHLLEGMRRIYEHIHYIQGGATGRLGHAIALGVDPQAWAESVGSVLMPAEERLWDLVWEWRLYTKYRIRPEFATQAPPGRIDVVLNKVRGLSDHIYGYKKKGPYQIEELAEAHHVLHCFLVPPFTRTPAVEGGYDTFLNAAKDISVRGGQARVYSHKRVGKILKAYLGDENTFHRGQTLIDVPLQADEVNALNAVQRALRLGIAQRGIVVEVNPSSNLLIGDLRDLRNHPILRLNPPVTEKDGMPPVAIAVGSDDPLTFSTELLREYTLLHRAASAAGYSERVIQEWLDSIRRTGMDARFTLAWSPKKFEQVVRAMCEYLHAS